VVFTGCRCCWLTVVGCVDDQFEFQGCYWLYYHQSKLLLVILISIKCNLLVGLIMGNVIVVGCCGIDHWNHDSRYWLFLRFDWP
jgi:hypothetical protein